MAMTVPFCMYHAMIASCGLMGVIQKENGTLLHAPFREIAIAEAVFNANEAMKNQKELRDKIKGEAPEGDSPSEPNHNSE
jgi:hypothetical protein